MALSDFQTTDTIARSKRGTTARTLGANPIAPTTAAKPSGLPGLIQKGLDVGKQVANIGGFVATKTAGFVKNTAVDLAKTGYSAGKTAVESQTQPILNKVQADIGKQLEQKQLEIQQAHKSGKLSLEDYQKATGELSKAFADLSKETQKISQGPSPVQRAKDVTETAVNMLSLGSLGLAEVGAKQAFQAGSREALTSLVTEAANPLEKIALKIPAVKSLIIRNLEQAGKGELKTLVGESVDQYLVRNTRQIAADLLIKRPIVYQTNIAQATDAYDKILKGNYKGALTDAAWLGSQMVEGGPIGLFFRGKDYLKGGLGKLAYGNQSFIDELSKKIGDGNPSQIARFLTTLEKKAPGEFTEAEKTFRILQETNLRTANKDVVKAAENVLTHYEQHGYDLTNLTPSQLYKDMNNWAKADELAQKTLRSGLVKGISPEDAAKYVVVRWDQTARQGVINAYKEGGLQGLSDLMQRPGVGWTNNRILASAVEDVANSARSQKEFEDGIKAITAARAQVTGMPKKVADELARLGFGVAEPVGGRTTPIVSLDETRKLVSGAIKGNTDIFDPATAPQPAVASIAGFFESAGLSPQASGKAGYRALSENVVASLDQLGMGTTLGLKNTQGGDITAGGQAILSRLQSYIENKRGVFGLGRNSAVTDIRQMTYGEIEDALKVSKADAKNISKAVLDGYMNTPLELRGLGDKVVDTLYRVNPLQKYYSRIQSALRYTYNPFFRTQERVETKLLSHAQASNLVWNKSRGELEAASKVLDDAGIFTSSLPGEAAQDQVLGRITANITAGQKRDLAGLALDIANARGIPLSTLAVEHADEVDDALRVVVQYPRKGVLASPLARTLNLAFFPMRYNAKVTLLAAETLAKQPPTIQKAVLHSLFNMKDWLKSDEGLKWQQNHADAIQVFNWITPINSIEYTMNLLGHKPNSIADFGVLGGLPLGVITQILDGQGILNLNRPYVNPKTGDVIPKYIPKTTQARAATALTDVLNSMFTYPGRTLGLPGKSATLRDAVKIFINTNGSDFEKKLETDRLTPLQKNMVRVLKGDTSPEALDALYNSPAEGQFNWYTLPPLNMPIRPTGQPAPNVQRRTNLPKKSAKAKKAKPVAQPI